MREQREGEEQNMQKCMSYEKKYKTNVVPDEEKGINTRVNIKKSKQSVR